VGVFIPLHGEVTVRMRFRRYLLQYYLAKNAQPQRYKLGAETALKLETERVAAVNVIYRAFHCSFPVYPKSRRYLEELRLQRVYFLKQR
jgi:hypothetical protein